MRTLFSKKGFTLIEIFIVIVIFVLLAAMIYVFFRTYQVRLEVKNGAETVKKVLVEVQSRTISSQGASRWGVHFENNKYVVYKVDLVTSPNDGYNALGVGNENYPVSGNLEFCEINLQNLDETAVQGVYYQYLEGINNQISGTVKICNKNDNTKFETITIAKTGTTETQEAVSSTSSSRHLHFRINRDATNASILRLNFTSDSVIRDIAFPDYYQEDEFFWSDIIMVNSAEQQLKIHTHSISASEAVFSIHRDERFNTRPLTISLRDINGDGDPVDSLTIVSYDANDDAAKGESSDVEMYVQ